MRKLGLILGCLLGLIQAPTPGYADDSLTSQTWLVMGDSLSAAYGIAIDEGWVALLQTRLQTQKQAVRIVNASISGETTSGGKQRLPALMQTHQPSVMILELGANDALRGQSLVVTKRNLESMIQSCLQARFQCTPVLLGIRLPTNYGPAYDKFLQKVYADLAQTYQLAWDPFFLETVALDPDYMQQDGLHPNAAAQPLILQRIWPLLQPILSADK